MNGRPPTSPLFPSTTLFRSHHHAARFRADGELNVGAACLHAHGADDLRSEEHTSELQSLRHLVCRLFFLNERPPPDISPLSLHDALPISPPCGPFPG